MSWADIIYFMQHPDLTWIVYYLLLGGFMAGLTRAEEWQDVLVVTLFYPILLCRVIGTIIHGMIWGE